ncbi:hypothetical protein VTJ04DRAFT_2220 [Mycothermus thermophilus]|uniref:uncharacterized protein n=1 Tax=Humicola insolens TaxID=85995 RepID=UPI00374279E9
MIFVFLSIDSPFRTLPLLLLTVSDSPRHFISGFRAATTVCSFVISPALVFLMTPFSHHDLHCMDQVRFG